MLADDLADWTGDDYAAFLVGLHLGAVEGYFAVTNKHVFWTDNRLGNGLHAALLALVEAGVLEQRTEDSQFLWGSQTASRLPDHGDATLCAAPKHRTSPRPCRSRSLGLTQRR